MVEGKAALGDEDAGLCKDLAVNAEDGRTPAVDNGCLDALEVLGVFDLLVVPLEELLCSGDIDAEVVDLVAKLSR